MPLLRFVLQAPRARAAVVGAAVLTSVLSVGALAYAVVRAADRGAPIEIASPSVSVRIGATATR